MGEILQERNTRTSDFESNPLYSLTIESGVTPKTDRYERSSLVTKTEDLFKTVKPNEFVTNPMNLRFGALGYNKNAFTVSVSGYYDVFSIDDDKCSGFWNAYFKTPTAMNIFDNAATGSLIEKRRVKYSTLQQLAFYMPNDLSEKAEIGKYMDTFDHFITLHQRKYDKLQVLKKAMLEKMFPKNGSSVPEIRFKGFTDAWEQRKLIDLLDQPITDGPHETPNIVDDGIPFISADAIVDNKIDFTRKRGNITEEYDLQCRKKYKPEFHDVYLVKSGSTVGKVAIVETTQRFNIWSPLAAMRCKKNSNPYFLFALLQTKENQAQVKDKASNGTQPNLSMRALEQFDIVSPYSRNEQIKIGEFFNSLDHLITLHQRELEKLQNIKKSMLEKMFV